MKLDMRKVMEIIFKQMDDEGALWATDTAEAICKAFDDGKLGDTSMSYKILYEDLIDELKKSFIRTKTNVNFDYNELCDKVESILKYIKEKNGK